jgi:hypothetical protein
MKKEYRKPRVTRVRLKVEQTVLAACKIGVVAGPVQLTCEYIGSICSELVS